VKVAQGRALRTWPTETGDRVCVCVTAESTAAAAGELGDSALQNVDLSERLSQAPQVSRLTVFCSGTLASEWVKCGLRKLRIKLITLRLLDVHIV